MGFDVNALVFAAAAVLAFGIDRYAGEPPVRWHPVVWMGRYLGWAGRRLAPVAATNDPDFKSFWLGALAWSAGAAIVCAASWALQIGLMALPDMLGPVAGGVLAALLLGLALKPMLAWAMLRSEVLAVETALSAEHGGSLDAGRERLSWLVSRKVSQLTESQVRESAIESLAENLNDSVVAPLFWFLLLGLPGAALYRFANTADAMWGYPGVYKGQNWAWAGKWAARVDDVMSWLPARLTALLLLVLAGGLSVRALRSQASRTPSPNSGWPMAAMAMALEVSLRKPGVYVLNEDQPPPCAADTLRATLLASKVVVALVFVVIPAIFLIAFRLS